MISSSDGRLLALANIVVRFGGVVAVDDVSLEIGSGDRVAVIGPNGAGKTTLFRTISGEVFPTSGQIELFGRDVTRAAPHARAQRGLGRTYQITNIFAGLSVAENVAMAAQARTRRRYRAWWPLQIRGELGDRVGDALAQVQLTHRRDELARNLSHGEQRQLELALALASNPRLLLLDEPAAGLSSSERVLMRDIIERLPDELALILIEHDMALALELAQFVVALDNGREIARGSPAEIRENQSVQDVYLKSD